MSRQTINSAIKNLENRAIFIWRRLPVTGGTRLFLSTAKGEDFVKRTVDRMLDLEHYQVFARLEVQEQEQITEILRKYTRYMKEGAIDIRIETVLRFMKPYKRLCFFTLLVTVLDVAGGLLIPRLTADMVNIGVAGGSLDYMLEKGGQMI